MFMPIRIACHHVTRYLFDQPTQIYPHVLRLRPAPHCRTPIQAYSLKVRPEGHFINWQQDAFGNYLARLVFPEPSKELSIEVEVVADMVAYNPFDFFIEDYAEKCPFEYTRQERTELVPYLQKVSAGPLLSRWLEKIDREPMITVDFLVEINRRLNQDIAYSVRMEPGVQTCETTLRLALGSCRDTAWLLVQILRHLGLAARFVSGYLVQLSADEKSLDGPSGPETDFTDLHAWTEVYVPGAGWIGLDPTSGLLAGEGHLPLACTPHYRDAAPISGGVGPCEVQFDFAMTLTRVDERPRVTLPYREPQWEAIMDLGRRIDQRLAAQDVRLTIGGEPTFVSIDDMEGAEWTFGAVGPDKRVRSNILLQRLRER